MARSGLSATTRVVNVGVEFPISCYLFFCFFPVFFFSFSSSSPFSRPVPSRRRRRRSTKRRCAIKCHKMKCPTMKGNDGGGVRRKRTNREWTAEPIAMPRVVRPAFDTSVKCTACRIVEFSEKTTCSIIVRLVSEKYMTCPRPFVQLFHDTRPSNSFSLCKSVHPVAFSGIFYIWNKMDPEKGTGIQKLDLKKNCLCFMLPQSVAQTLHMYIH